MKSKWFKLISSALRSKEERSYSDRTARKIFNQEPPAYWRASFKKEYPGVSTSELRDRLRQHFPNGVKKNNLALLHSVLNRMASYNLVSKKVVNDSVREERYSDPWVGKEIYWSLTQKGEEYYEFHQAEIEDYLDRHS